MIDFDAIDAALRTAMPVLAVTAIPVLAVTAGVSLWLRGQDVEDDFNVDDYREPAPVHAAPLQLRPADDATQDLDWAAWNATTPVYAALAARPMPSVVAHRVARQWLVEIGQQARGQVAA